MVDPLSVAAAVAKAASSEGASEAEKTASGLLQRLLGPSADVIGEHWAASLANRMSNVRRVAQLADRRSSGAGAIPARVADGVFRAAQFADSEFAAEYLSGVLVSSRTLDGRDDSGISWTRLIDDLSSDQIGLHYNLYAAACPLIATNAPQRTDSAMCAVHVFTAFSDLNRAMRWEGDGPTPGFREAVYGLQRQGLLQTIHHGSADFLGRLVERPESLPYEAGLIYRVRIPGLMMYLWGLGHGRESVTKLLDPLFAPAVGDLSLPAPPRAVFAGIG